MENYYSIVKNYLLELGYSITHEDEADQVFVIDDEANGIKNCVIGCADPILLIEQYIMECANPSVEICVELLKKNRDIIHGAFVLDETGTKVIFRDTLQISNLDMNELEGSLNSLSLLLTEYSDELINFSKQ